MNLNVSADFYEAPDELLHGLNEITSTKFKESMLNSDDIDPKAQILSYTSPNATCYLDASIKRTRGLIFTEMTSQKLFADNFDFQFF